MSLSSSTPEAPRVRAGYTYRQQHAATLTASAAEAFAKHAIVKASEDRWRIMVPRDDGKPGWCSHYAAEIVVLWGGSILVHGDIQTVMWSRYSDDADPRNVLRWMGRHPSVDCYCVQKAEAGIGHAIVTVFDSEAFEADLAELLADELEACAEDGDDPDVNTRVVAVREAIKAFTRYSEDPQTIRSDLRSAGFEGENLWPMGLVTNARVYYAHAALRRLCALLEIK